MSTISVTGDITSQEVEVEVDITELVSEHLDELKEEMKAQGYDSDNANEELVTTLRDKIYQVQQAIHALVIQRDLDALVDKLECIRTELGDIE